MEKSDTLKPALDNYYKKIHNLIKLEEKIIVKNILSTVSDIYSCPPPTPKNFIHNSGK